MGKTTLILKCTVDCRVRLDGTFITSLKEDEVKKITILDPNMLNTLWEHKIDKEYSKLLKLIYSLVSNDDTTSTDVLIAYTEIERIKEYLLTLKNKGLKKELLDKYLKKLYILELELKKIHVMELTEEIGKGR